MIIGIFYLIDRYIKFLTDFEITFKVKFEIFISVSGYDCFYTRKAGTFAIVLS